MKNSTKLHPIWLIQVFSLGLFLTFSSCNYPFRAFVHTVPTPQDHKIFYCENIDCSYETGVPSTFIESQGAIDLPQPNDWIIGKDLDSELSYTELMEKTNTYAFIVFRNDSILFEQYANGYSNESPQIVFSLSKVLITSLLDIALQENIIESTAQKVSDFLPEFKQGNKTADITLNNVLNMTTGLQGNDYGNPFVTGKLYYSHDLDNVMYQAKTVSAPSTEFVYKSIDSQILGRCIEQATEQSISHLLTEKLIEPLDFSNPVILTYDQEGGNERVFGGMAISAQDLLKFSYLFINDGKSRDGQQIVSKTWIEEIQNRNPTKGQWLGYKNGWWRDTFIQNSYLGDSDFMAAGFGGQRIYVNPEEQTIIIRLGKNTGGVNWQSSLGMLAQKMNRPHKKNPMITECDLSGTYLHKESNSIIELQQTNNAWVLKSQKGIFKKERIKLEQFCTKSIFHYFRHIRLIFPELDYQTDEVSQLLLDDGKGKLFTFSKID